MRRGPCGCNRAANVRGGRGRAGGRTSGRGTTRYVLARADSGYPQFVSDEMVDLVTWRSVIYPGYAPQPQDAHERVRYRR